MDRQYPPGAARARRLLGPWGVAGAITVVTVTGLVAVTMLPGPGWVLAWLALGLTAGYALSGSV
ncbi:MAG: hypothetical protein GEV09_17200 [Pseudonocardiaceae bacterium]|nr:hypothetical protein [Pseudonocardiaceae bacterium]